MGTASIVLGIIGICISWIPGFGWIGVFLGVLAWVTGIPSVTRWFNRAGYGPWGVSGIVLGLMAFVIGIAYQIKYAGGSLDGWVVPLDGPLPYIVSVFCSLVVAFGLVLSRKKRRLLVLGEVLAFCSIVAIGTVLAFTLITAERQFSKTPSTISEFR